MTTAADFARAVNPPKGPFYSIDDIIEANYRKRERWFSPSNCRAFGTRVLDDVYGGRYFVTSERFPHPTIRFATQRRYSVRVAADDGGISTVGEFGQYPSARSAKAAARALGQATVREVQNDGASSFAREVP